MSIDTKQIIHIASEIVIISALSGFFIHKNNKLESRIEELETKICKLEEIIQHQDLNINKLINTVTFLQNPDNLLNNQMLMQQKMMEEEQQKHQLLLQQQLFEQQKQQQIQKQQQMQMQQQQNKTKKEPKKKRKTDNPIVLSSTPNMDSGNIKTIIMTASLNPLNQDFSNDNGSKVEEINDDATTVSLILDDDKLDSELEKELRDLEEEELSDEIEDLI